MIDENAIQNRGKLPAQYQKFGDILTGMGINFDNNLNSTRTLQEKVGLILIARKKLLPEEEQNKQIGTYLFCSNISGEEALEIFKLFVKTLELKKEKDPIGFRNKDFNM